MVGGIHQTSGFSISHHTLPKVNAGVKRTNLQSYSLFRLKLIQKLNPKLRIPWNIVNHRDLHRRLPRSPSLLCHPMQLIAFSVRGNPMKGRH